MLYNSILAKSDRIHRGNSSTNNCYRSKFTRRIKKRSK